VNCIGDTCMAAKPSHAAQVWLGILKEHMPRIEARLIQWVAQGRIIARVPKDSDNTGPVVDPIVVLKQAVRQAERRIAAAMAPLKAAESGRRAAEAALNEASAAHAGKKGKKSKEDPTLRASLDACEELVSELQPAVDSAKQELARAEKALTQAQADVIEQRERAQREYSAEARYSIAAASHLKKTGQRLACGVPHMVEGAKALARERPAELLISMATLRGLLLELCIAVDISAIRTLFSELNRQAREAGGDTPLLRPPPAPLRPSTAPLSPPPRESVLPTPAHRTAPRLAPLRPPIFASAAASGDTRPSTSWGPREPPLPIRPVSLATLRSGILSASGSAPPLASAPAATKP